MSPAGPPRKPYFLRAIHEWIGDAGMTPQLIVDATLQGVDVPSAYVRDGKIVLNVGAEAVRELRIDNEAVDFTARFGTAVHSVHVPMAAILGIYARESGEGLAFGNDEGPSPESPGPGDGPEGGGEPSEGRPRLTVVK